MSGNDGYNAPTSWEGSRPLVSSLNLIDLANYLAEVVAKAAGGNGCVIRTFDRARRRTDILAVYGLSRDYLRRISEQDDSVAAALGGQPTVIHDLSTRLADWAAEGPGVASLVAVPMALRGSVTGVLQVYSAQPREFTDQDINILLAMGSMAAAAIESARVAERDRVLFEVARATSSTLELKEVARLIADNATKAMAAKGCSVRIVDRNRRCLELLGSCGLSRDYLEKGSVDIEKSIAEALEGKPVIIFDAANDKRVQYPDAALKEGVCSIACVPMVLKGVTTGVMRVYTAVPYEFTADDIEFLTALASAGAAAIENARLYDGIKQDFEVLMDEIVYMRRAARSMKKERGL